MQSGWQLSPNSYYNVSGLQYWYYALKSLILEAGSHYIQEWKEFPSLSLDTLNWNKILKKAEFIFSVFQSPFWDSINP